MNTKLLLLGALGAGAVGLGVYLYTRRQPAPEGPEMTGGASTGEGVNAATYTKPLGSSYTAPAQTTQHTYTTRTTTRTTNTGQPAQSSSNGSGFLGDEPTYSSSAPVITNTNTVRSWTDQFWD